MPNDRVLSMIGLAKRAGKISGGSLLCEKDIRSKRSKLIIIASDASDTSKKALYDLCRYYKVKTIEYSGKADLGAAVGASGYRAAVSVNDENFAAALLDKYAEQQSGRNGE